MSNRLSIITTGSGDDGSTSLGDGQRVSKTHVRIQHDLFDLGAELAVPGYEELPAKPPLP